MKLTIVSGFFLPMPPAAGGATEKSWDRLAREFVQRGHEVTVISRRWPGFPDEEVRDGVRYLRVRGFDHTASLRRNLWLDFLWSLRVRRRLPPADIAVLHCVALPALLPRSGRAGRIVVMCGRMPKGQYRYYGRVSRVLAVSDPVRRAVLAQNPSLKPSLRVVGYPIRWQELSSARPPRDPAAPITIGYIGRLHPEKGLDLLTAALAKLASHPDLPPWRAILAGPQTVPEGGGGIGYIADLRHSLARVPADRWSIQPPVYDEDRLDALYRDLDIFCYPSQSARGETFGVSVAEAMAAGAAPVVSALPCFGDFVRDHQTGLVFDHGGAHAADRLATALAALVEDGVLRTRLAAAAQSEVRRYDFGPYAESLLADFSGLK